MLTLDNHGHQILLEQVSEFVNVPSPCTMSIILYITVWRYPDSVILSPSLPVGIFKDKE